MEIISFEKLEKLFYLRILLALNGRQHSKRSEEPSFAQQSYNISTSSCLTEEG